MEAESEARQGFEAPAGADENNGFVMSREQMLEQWRKTHATTPLNKDAQRRKPLGECDANAIDVRSSALKSATKVAWVESTPSKQGPSLNDIKARVDVIRRDSMYRDVRRESILGTPMTPTRNIPRASARGCG